MAFTHRMAQTFQRGGRNYTATVDKEAAHDIGLEESIPSSSTDLEIAVEINATTLVSIMILADQDLTIETNSSSAPDDTITVRANVPIWWEDGSSETAPITADVTSIFVTSTNAATLRIFALQDPTPA
jgi:hypothetical protein